MTDPRTAYRAAGRQAVEEAFHRFLIDLGVQPQIRVRLVRELRELNAANPVLSCAWIVAGTGPDGKPRAELVTEQPEKPLFTLEIGKWRKDFANELRTELAAERSGTAH